MDQKIEKFRVMCDKEACNHHFVGVKTFPIERGRINGVGYLPVTTMYSKEINEELVYKETEAELNFYCPKCNYLVTINKKDLTPD